MVVNKRKKNSRQRGSHTHGWGAMKKHRGSGNQGGVGMANTGKRGDAKKPSIWKGDYFGKSGFIKKGQTININTINMIDIELNLNDYLQKKLASNKDGKYIIDLKELGFNKLLSTGKVYNKYQISAKFASKKAIAKVKEAGGEVILIEQKKTS